MDMDEDYRSKDWVSEADFNAVFLAGSDRLHDFDLKKARATAQGRKDVLLAYLLEYHVGKKNAIKAPTLAGMFDDRTDRPTRLAIQALRNDGHLILSSSTGPDKGYYMAATVLEYEEFRQRNFRARALSILKTDRAMVKNARRLFGDAVQLDLFETEE
jgi:hypothetical protein